MVFHNVNIVLYFYSVLKLHLSKFMTTPEV